MFVKLWLPLIVHFFGIIYSKVVLFPIISLIFVVYEKTEENP